MIPTTWFKMTEADAAAMKTPPTYIKWIIDRAKEGGYLSDVSGDVKWGDIDGNILDQGDLISYISNQLSTIYINIDGGFAASVYLTVESADGGGA